MNMATMPDEVSEGTDDAAPANEAVLTPSGGHDDGSSGAPAAPAPAVDHHAAIAAVMPDESARDALAARVIASGGVEGVDLNVSGENAEQFAGHVSAIQSELQAAADAHVKAAGIEPSDLYAYMRKRGDDVVRSTALLMFHGRDPALALNSIIAEYRRTPAGRR